MRRRVWLDRAPGQHPDRVACRNRLAQLVGLTEFRTISWADVDGYRNYSYTGPASCDYLASRI